MPTALRPLTFASLYLTRRVSSSSNLHTRLSAVGNGRLVMVCVLLLLLVVVCGWVMGRYVCGVCVCVCGGSEALQPDQVWCRPPVLFLHSTFLVYTGAGASLTGPVLFGSKPITWPSARQSLCCTPLPSLGVPIWMEGGVAAKRQSRRQLPSPLLRCPDRRPRRHRSRHRRAASCRSSRRPAESARTWAWRPPCRSCCRLRRRNHSRTLKRPAICRMSPVGGLSGCSGSSPAKRRTHSRSPVFLQGNIIPSLSGATPSRRRDCHSAAPPSTFSRCFNVDEQGVSAKRQSRRRLAPPYRE